MTELEPTLTIPRIVREILAKRGMDEGKMAAFLFPDFARDLHDPYLMLDMDKAVDRIVVARERGERVAIYGDYDIDGITASTVLLEMMGHLGVAAESYIPDRFEEGYGINQDALATLKAKGFDLVVSVDCGITSVKEAKWAQDNGLDLIITDHHAVPEVIPEAVAVINPKRSDDPYPFKDLAGVGVAFKLAQALQQRTGVPAEGQEKWLLDVVALGTVCDVVTLVGENRVLASYGLKVMRRTRRPGLRALATVGGARIDDITAYHLGFVLGPRMNAAGRLEHAARSLQLMLTDDPVVAGHIARELDALNTQRKADQQRIYEAAEMMAQQYASDPIIVLSGAEWSHGVVGIVASKLVERWHKPVLIAQNMGETTKGSARSVPGFNMVEALRSCQELFIKMGGHYFAAGYTLPSERFDDLRVALCQYAVEHPADPYVDDVPADVELEGLHDVDWELLHDIALLEPFGAGNVRPMLRLGGLQLVDKRTMGKDGTHLRLGLSDGTDHLSGVGFGLAEAYRYLPVGAEVEIIGYLNKNEYNGNVSIQLMIEKVIYEPVQPTQP